MISRWNTEFAEKQKPTILLYGDKHPLMQQLVSDYMNDLNVILFEKNNEHLKEFFKIKGAVQYITPEILQTFENLGKKIDYALLFFEIQEDKQYINAILNLLDNHKSKIVIVFDVRSFQNYYDFFLNVKKRENIFFLLLGDLFGKEIKTSHSLVAKIIDNVKEKKVITLTGNDLSPIFAISVVDALKGINHILFGASQKNKMFYLFYNHPQTVISSLNVLKRIEPELEMIFKNEEDKKTLEKSFEEMQIEIQEKLLITPQFLDINFLGFEKSAEQILLEKPVESKDSTLEKYSVAQNQRISIYKKFYFASLLIIGSFIFYAFINVILFLFIVIILKTSISMLQKADAKTSSTYTMTARLISSIIDPFVLQGNTLFFLSSDFQLYKDWNSVQKATKLMLLASDNFKDLDQIRSGEQEDTLHKHISDIYTIYFELQRIKVENPKRKQIIEDILGSYSLNFASIAQVLPELLGYNQEKTYLLLFQNNGELRPTGGFIGSVAEVSISKGKLTNILLRDVYEADGQLKVHIEPHYIIRRYLQPHLYLRDSNFNLNFEESATFAALLYQLETGKKVDGVIAFDYEVLKRIIKTMGSISLTDYKKTLDETNIIEFMQDTIEENFFPGSNQKKNLLISILNQLSLKIEQSSNNIYKIAKITPDLLKEKHILFFFNNPFIQPVFRINGISDSYIDLRERKEGGLYDTLSINEANIGVNKANTSIQRAVLYDVELRDKAINSKVTLTIDNSSQKSLDYQAYTRIVAPLGSTLTFIAIDGKEQSIIPAVTDYAIYEKKDFKQPFGLEVDQTQKNGFHVFGFIISVPKQNKQILEVSYKNGFSERVSDFQNYSLLFIKQPGTENYPFKLTIHYPDAKDNIFSKEYEASGDKEINVGLVKK